MSGQEPEPPVTWGVILTVAAIRAARLIVQGRTRLRGLWHRARCKECRHAR